MEENKIISKLSEEDKILLVSGKDSWWFNGIKSLNLPSIHLTDGPYGIREEIREGNIFNKGKTSICYPASALTACSFDTDLLFSLGEALSLEARNKNIHILLGPGVNIKHSPLCGRNFEYISEDPFLAGKLSSAYIKGLNKNNVGASIKHFALNNQETFRMNSNSVVDSRALHEIYLKPFEIAIKESSPATVMSSYNMVNGEYASENHFLLKETLRDKWGFKGTIISDWGAVSDLSKAIKAGLNVEMPFSSMFNLERLKKDLKKDEKLKQNLNEDVISTIETIKRYKDNTELEFDYEKYHDVAAKIASESMVLLKNENILPLKIDEKVAFIGDFAFKPRFRGGGSSAVTPYKVINSVDDANKRYKIIGAARGFDLENDIIDEKLAFEAVELAKKSDKVVLFLGLNEESETEGKDRNNIDLFINQIDLFYKIHDINKNIVVVLMNGSSVSMPFAYDAKGILEAYLGGEGTSEAINDILFGKVNPSGRLAETFLKNLDDCPNTLFAPSKNKNVLYKDSIFVGYRYYISKNIETLYDFGHGLSYSNFKYTNFKFNKSKFSKDNNYEIEISFSLLNDSDIDGKEVVQVYISKPNNLVYNPKRELVSFKKVFLKAHENKNISLIINSDAFKYFDENLNDFNILNGDYLLSINKDARNVIFEENVIINEENSAEPLSKTIYKNYFDLNIRSISDEEYINLFKLHDFLISETAKFSMNSTINELKKSFAGKIFYKAIKGIIKNAKDKNTINFIFDTPLRSICGFTNFVLNEKIFKHLLDAANKKFIITNLIIFGIKCLKVMNKISF